MLKIGAESDAEKAEEEVKLAVHCLVLLVYEELLLFASSKQFHTITFCRVDKSCLPFKGSFYHSLAPKFKGLDRERSQKQDMTNFICIFFLQWRVNIKGWIEMSRTLWILDC